MADLILGQYPRTSVVELVGGPLDGGTYRLPDEAVRIFPSTEKDTWKATYIEDGRVVHLDWDNRPGEDEPYAWYAERHAGRYLRWTDAVACWHPYA